MTVRFCSGDRLYTGRAFHVAAQNGSSTRPAFVVHLQREAEADDSLVRVCEEYRLTAREREALSGIATGMTSKELAERMRIRPSTVKAFLRVMMIKMGVSNRAGVVAKLLTTSSSAQESSSARPKRAVASGE
ncbi:MAG: helix-turn-helix transcriptional regulator [Acidobacteriia bacterium]|nr:helix-turn-helix transcriptional regulator [Terriglobia bacterium]